jgi:cysteinyl-tRNA synthetase
MGKIFLTNTMGREKQEFKPLEKGIVKMYTCGPTVYNYLHIGNYKASIFYDLLHRFFQMEGYQVKHIENLTDVDDKTVKASNDNNVTLKEWTDKFIKIYLDDKKKLRLVPPTKQTRATEFIPQMIKFIEVLMKKGYAYKSEDGSVYFSVEKFKNYGQLSGIKKKELKVGTKNSKDEYSKETAADFALWKAWDEADGKVFWEAPFGKGRPGWHIECSVMINSELGDTIDIHSGGADLVFPHHENEIAQTETFTGKKFCNYWLHEEFLLVDGKKMSKSLRNFFTLEDLKNLNPLAIKLELSIPHYRTQMNFTMKGIQEKEKLIEKTNNLIKRILAKLENSEKTEKTNITKENNSTPLAIASKKFTDTFILALEDDLNTPMAFSSFNEFLGTTNKLLDENKVSAEDALAAIDALKKFNSIFDFMDFSEKKKEELGGEIKKLIEQRNAFRKEKKFAESDAIRKKLETQGIILTDNKDGTTTWEKK